MWTTESGEERCTGLKDLGDLESPKLTVTPSISYIKESELTLRYQDAAWQVGVIQEEVLEVANPVIANNARLLPLLNRQGEAYPVVHYRLPFYDMECNASIRGIKITMGIKSAGTLYLNEKEVYRIELVCDFENVHKQKRN